jgi:hypothetical protein
MVAMTRMFTQKEKQVAAEGVVASLRLSAVLLDSRFFSVRKVRRMCGDDDEVFALVRKAINRRPDGTRYQSATYSEDGRIVLVRNLKRKQNATHQFLTPRLTMDDIERLKSVLGNVVAYGLEFECITHEADSCSASSQP